MKAKLFNLLLNLILLSIIIYGVLHYGSLNPAVSLTNLSPSFSTWAALLVVMLLIPLNWGIETFKWNRLLRPYFKMNIVDSLKSVLVGVSTSLFTPNRIGELAGRLYRVPAHQKAATLYINLYNSFAQQLVTCCIGLLSFLWMWPANDLLSMESIKGNYLVFILIAILLSAYLFSNWLNRRMSWLSKLLKQLSLFKNESSPQGMISLRDRLQALGLSFLRYLVFSAQFIILAHYVFHVEISIINLFFLLAQIYFIQAIFPLLWLGGLFARVSVSWLVFEWYGSSGWVGVEISTILWICNLFIPAIAGYFIYNPVKRINRRLKFISA
jgi:hypothetical protein